MNTDIINDKIYLNLILFRPILTLLSRRENMLKKLPKRTRPGEKTDLIFDCVLFFLCGTDFPKNRRFHLGFPLAHRSRDLSHTSFALNY